jgi:trigger factor
MQEISVEALSQTECKISVNVPAEVVDKKFNEFYENIKKKAQVPGFRAGKAPLSVLKQHYGLKARAPVSAVLIQEYYDKAIRESDVNPVAQPNIVGFTKTSEHPGRFNFDNSYEVEFTVEVIPKIDPVGYMGLDLQMVDVDEAALAAQHLIEYREKFATKSPVTNRGANLGDALVMDFVGYIDSVAFEGGAAKGYTLERLGKGNFIPGFEEQLLGMRLEETKKVFVTFPMQYQAQQLAGKNATFDVTVHNIISSQLATEDEDLAIMAGFTSLAEMKASLLVNAQKERRLMIRQRMDQQIMTKVLAVNVFDVPKSMVEEELRNIRARVKAEQVSDEIMAELRRSAEFSVRRSLIANAIYEKEPTTEVTPEELNQMLDEYAAKEHKTKDELISALYNSKQMDSFVGILRFAKVVDFIIDNAKKGAMNDEEPKGQESGPEATEGSTESQPA